jgi:Trk K+ transport system NAD-binding subunit
MALPQASREGYSSVSAISEKCHADSIEAMLSDEQNHRICELVYEHFGTRNVIVRLNNRAYLKRFHKLGALVVDPDTAMVNLLDQFVRSPSAATLLLELEAGRKREQHRFSTRPGHSPYHH